MKNRLFKYSILSALLTTGSLTFAETPVLPGSVQPSQVSHALRSQQPTMQSNVVAPSAVTATEPGLPKKLLEQAKKIKFKLNKIELQGNHVYTYQQLEPFFKKYLHKTVSVADLFYIMQAMTNYYRNNGYILSRVILVPQKVTDGVIRMRVIEGYIGQVNVSGHPAGSRRLIQSMGDKIKEPHPLELNHMEKYLLLLNEIPGIKEKAVLQPAKINSGASDLILDTQLIPVTGYFSYDNYGTRYLGPQQITGNIAINSFALPGDSGQVTFIKTPKGGELTYFDMNYNMPIRSEGTRLLLGGNRTATHPLFVLQPADINSIYHNYYATLFYPAWRTRSQSLTYKLGFNFTNVSSDATQIPLYSDHLRPIDVGLLYNFADSHGGNNLINLDLKHGLPILDYTTDTSLNARTSHPGANANYTKLMFTLNRLQAIKGPFSVFLEATGQWGFNPLLASEQFTYGGPQLGRGYDIGEIIGDRGLAGTVEFRFDGYSKFFFAKNYQLYAFYDAGEIWNIIASGGLPKKSSATSLGGGVRFYFSRTISGNLMLAQPLTKQVAAEKIIGEGRRPSVWFSVVATFP